ncbi:hypothetical protein QFZ25_003810 [Bacillus atrophaeus]|nr:hypothetical protein S101359_03806 [Bacillus atrophaeus]MDQ0929750.1 hypothetical protein [Bacillus atrophaeus]PRS01744.1 hypothetical protein C6W24_05785 [Bacillus atrophaeus]
MLSNNFLYYLLKINHTRILFTLIALMLLNMSVFYNNTLNEVTSISFIRILSNILGSPTSFMTVCIFLLNMNSWHFSNYVVSRFNNRKIFFRFLSMLVLLRTIVFLVLSILTTILTALILKPGMFMNSLQIVNVDEVMQIIYLLLGWLMILIIVQLIILMFELKLPVYGTLIGSVIVLMILFNDMYDSFSILFIQAISSTFDYSLYKLFYDRLYLLFVIVFLTLICVKLTKSFQMLRR